MYKNKIDKKLDNSQIVYSTMNKENDSRYDNKSINNRYASVSIDKKISDIFNSNDYIYKADVTIVTDNDTMYKRIVARNKNNLITMDNEYIPISIIRDIYK